MPHDAYGIKDMVFGGMKIKHKSLEDWIAELPSRTKLIKIDYQEGSQKAHALGVIEEGPKQSELFFVKIEKVD